MNRNHGILFFRLTMGALMCAHGVMKIVRGPEFIEKLGGMPPFIPDVQVLHVVLGWLAVACEVLGGLGVITGIKFRWACGLIVAVMIPAWAYHLGQVSDFPSFMTNTWPLEIALVFTAFAIIGKGRASID